MAASTMMFALPMSWALLCFAKIGPGPVTQAATAPVSVAVADVVDPIEDRPRITISLEPSAVTRPDEPEAPLALPSGYLVPDHGSEDSAHAGY